MKDPVKCESCDGDYILTADRGDGSLTCCADPVSPGLGAMRRGYGAACTTGDCGKPTVGVCFMCMGVQCTDHAGELHACPKEKEECSSCAAKDAEIAKIAAVLKDVQGALDDANAPGDETTEPAKRIDDLREERDFYSQAWSNVIGVVCPSREPDDEFTDNEIVEAVKETLKRAELAKSALSSARARIEAAEALLSPFSNAWHVYVSANEAYSDPAVETDPLEDAVELLGFLGDDDPYSLGENWTTKFRNAAAFLAEKPPAAERCANPNCVDGYIHSAQASRVGQVSGQMTRARPCPSCTKPAAGGGA